MPRLLIAGFGYVGKATAELFVANGWEVEGWTRSELTAANVTTRAVDISDATSIPRDLQFDAIVQCASTRGGDAAAYRRVYFDGVRNVLAAFPATPLLFASSTSVYPQRTGEWVKETSDASPDRETGKILRATEDIVLQSGGIVARLAGIHGPGRSFILRSFLNGTARLDGDRYVNQVHRDDIAAAFLTLLTQTPLQSASRVFNVVDDKPILRSECYRWLAAKLNRDIPPVTGGVVARKRGDSNKRVSNARLRSAGWAPRFPTFAAAMEGSILPALESLGC